MQSNSDPRRTNPRRTATVARAVVVIGSGLGVGLVTAHVADQTLAAATPVDQAELPPEAVPTPDPVVVTVVRTTVVTPEPIIVHRTVRPQATTTGGDTWTGGTSGSSGSSAPAPAAPAPRFTPAPPPAPAPAAKPDAVSRSS